MILFKDFYITKGKVNLDNKHKQLLNKINNKINSPACGILEINKN